MASLFQYRWEPGKHSSKALQITTPMAVLACRKLIWNSFTVKPKLLTAPIMPTLSSLRMGSNAIARDWRGALLLFVGIRSGSLESWYGERLQCCGSSERRCAWQAQVQEPGDFFSGRGSLFKNFSSRQSFCRWFCSARASSFIGDSFKPWRFCSSSLATTSRPSQFCTLNIATCSSSTTSFLCWRQSAFIQSPARSFKGQNRLVPLIHDYSPPPSPGFGYAV